MQGLYEEEAQPNYGILGWRHVCPFNPPPIAFGQHWALRCLDRPNAHCSVVHVGQGLFALCSRDQFLQLRKFSIGCLPFSIGYVPKQLQHWFVLP